VSFFPFWCDGKLILECYAGGILHRIAKFIYSLSGISDVALETGFVFGLS
jgi:hypothetical protein